MKYFALILAFCASTLSAQEVPKSAAQMHLSFVPLVKQAAPAVASIYAKIMTQERQTPLRSDPFFERFFREQLAPRPRVQNSLGSGVILSADGILVSNYHVVGMATEITVVLSDRREFSAQVLLGDAEADLAILKIDAPDDLPFLPLRSSDSVEVGELALAIGNPFGVGQTVSSGIVSGLARSGVSGDTGRGYFIQTDAPINPGNSGGALIDMAGRLIGVNTSILTRSGGSNGIGFAIPADLIAAFVAQAQEGQTEFMRPWAGVSGQLLDSDMAATLGLDRSGGIILSGLHAASPFRDAGLEVGDVIVEVGGQQVNTPSEMIYRMGVAGVEKQVEIRYLRGSRERTASVSLMPAPDEPSRDLRVMEAPHPFAGLTLVRINPAVLAEMNLRLEIEGVTVTKTGSGAARAGLRVGDVVLAVNGDEVMHPDEVIDALSARRGRLEMVVLRGTRRITMRFRG